MSSAYASASTKFAPENTKHQVRLCGRVVTLLARTAIVYLGSNPRAVTCLC